MNAMPAELAAHRTDQHCTLALRGLGRSRRDVAGRLVLPGDADWDGARSAWNVSAQQPPLAVVEVADVEDVGRAVRWAVDHGREVTAQPAGHGTTDGLDRVLVLRTQALNGIDVDVAARTVRVGAGVTAGELLAELDGTGLTFPAGSNPDAAVAAMSIGGPELARGGCSASPPTPSSRSTSSTAAAAASRQPGCGPRPVPGGLRRRGLRARHDGLADSTSYAPEPRRPRVLDRPSC